MLSFGWLLIVLLIGTANGGEVPLAFRLSLQKIGHEFNEKVEKDQWKTNSFYRGFFDEISISNKPLYTYTRYVVDEWGVNPGVLKEQTFDYVNPIMQYHVVKPANNNAIVMGIELFFDGKDIRKCLTADEFEQKLGLSVESKVDINQWLSMDLPYNYITAECGAFRLAYLYHKGSLISALVADKKSLAVLDTQIKRQKQSEVRTIDCFGIFPARRIVKLTDDPVQWLTENNDKILERCETEANAKRFKRQFLRLAEQGPFPHQYSLMTFNALERYCQRKPITEIVGKYPVGYKAHHYYSADGQICYHTVEMVEYFSVIFMEMFKGLDIDCSTYKELEYIRINEREMPLNVTAIHNGDVAKILTRNPAFTIIALEDILLNYQDGHLAYIKMFSDKFDTLNEYHKNLCIIDLLKDRNIIPKVCSYHEIFETK